MDSLRLPAMDVPVPPSSRGVLVTVTDCDTNRVIRTYRVNRGTVLETTESGTLRRIR